MSDGFEFKLTPETFQSLQIELIIDIYAKILSLQSFIVEYLSDNQPDKYDDKQLTDWFSESVNSNRLNLIAEITRKHSM